MGASELYPLVDAKIDVLLADWKNACRGAEMAILEVANVLEDPSVRAREARIIMLRERAIVFSRVLEYFLKQGNGNCDTMARSNGLVVNAQIITMSRGLSQLWPDISIRLRTNRVSSLSNRPPNRRASMPGHVAGLAIVRNQIRRLQRRSSFGVSAG